MLTLPEQIGFFVLLTVSISLSIRSFSMMIRIIKRGQGVLHPDNFLSGIREALSVLITQKTVLKKRPVVSVLHAFIAWAFILYFLVNIGDVLMGFIPGFHFLGRGAVGNIYRFFVDIFSVLAIISMIYFLLRRFVFGSGQLRIADKVLVLPEARFGMRRDSLIVGFFILFHIGFRFLGETIHISLTQPDPWQPMASVLSHLWGSVDSQLAIVSYHVSWWLAVGLILVFIPYFPFSKHAHLFMGPVNYLFRPRRPVYGTMGRLNLEDEDAEQFGVATLEHLDKKHILDAYACIMCNRCQDACPAYVTGKELSPSALEINKRYFINRNQKQIVSEEGSGQPLVGFAISTSALWACTSCAACIEVCPVGNEPMQDILNMRRDRVLMESDFPKQLQGAFNGMERNSNPWNMNEDRLIWAKEEAALNVKTVEENPDFDILYWVGCAGAFEARAQNIARAFVKILHAADVNFSVLGNLEKCTGDSARRAGNEYLFSMMAEENVAILNNKNVKKIVTTCPHCLHTLKNEYPQFGGHYEVVHHSQFIEQLVREKKIAFASTMPERITYHDPCYLGRHNRIFDAPRADLRSAGLDIVEMNRSGVDSFCCGAGGAQMWKEEEPGDEDVRKNRYIEAGETGASVLATGCPFCMTMLGDAGKEMDSELPVRDIAEILADRL